MLDFAWLVQECAPNVSPVLMHALVRKESAFNQFAIGMHAGEKPAAVKQPTSLREAVALAEDLKSKGKGFSVGLAQINAANLPSLKLTWEQAFDPCTNLAAGEKVLRAFYAQARTEGYRGVDAVWAALRGYNSGSVDKTVSNGYADAVFRYMANSNDRNRVTADVTNRGVAAPAVDREELASRSDESRELFDKADAPGIGF